jgi:leucyl-tRNA synthetase
MNPSNVTFNEHSETFVFEPLDENAKGLYESIEIFTTRADTIFGALFLALSPSHPLVLHEAQHDSGLQAFLEAAKTVRHPDSSETPGHLLNISAFNPIREVNAMAAFPAHHNRAYIYRPMPVFVAPYAAFVLPHRGAIMGVPAHNRKDHTFWRHIVEEKPIPSVISRSRQPGRPDPPLNKVKFLAKHIGDKPFEEKGRLNALCGLFAGLCSDAAIQLLPERVPGITLVGRQPQINSSFLRRMWDLI